MAGPVRLAILGTGNMAATMAAAAQRVPGLQITGVASRTPERARALSARLGLPKAYSGIDEALTDPQVDAVYIASEPAHHAAASLAALAAGKSVLCEKPCAINAEQAERIAAAAAASGKLFMEAIATPFLPAVDHALEEALSGRLGTARHFRAEFGYPVTRASHPVCFAAEGGGVLPDRAVYLVALARLALGPIASVHARVVRDEGIDVDATLVLGHAGGGTSELAASFTALLGNDAVIGCSRGAISLMEPLLACERVRIASAGAPAAPAPPSRLKRNPLLRRARSLLPVRGVRRFSYGASQYAPELLHFRDLVRAGAVESPVLPPSLSLEVHRVLAEARAQGEGG